MTHSACSPLRVAPAFCMVRLHYRDNSYYSHHPLAVHSLESARNFSHSSAARSPYASPNFFFSPLFSFTLQPFFLKDNTHTHAHKNFSTPCLRDWIDPSPDLPPAILNRWPRPLNPAWGDYASFLSVFPLTCPTLLLSPPSPPPQNFLLTS